MPSKAAQLVAQAKEWASQYGPYANGPEGAVLTVPLRVKAAWNNNDADAIAALFTDNGSMLVGDDQLKGREEIRSYLTTAFQGPFQATQLAEEPLEIRFLTPTVAFAVTQGGLLFDGESKVAPEREVRTTWIITKQDGDWRLVSHQSSPIRG